MRFCVPALLVMCLLVGVTAAEPERVHVPAFPPSLQRNLVPVTILVVDAQDQELVFDSVHARGLSACLYRVWRPSEHARHLETPFVVNFDRITGGTKDVPGLAPGQYRLDVLAGQYGPVQHTFTVENEALELTVRTPNSRHLWSVRYTDAQDRPLPWVPALPDQDLPPATRSFPASGSGYLWHVLRNPPRSMDGRGGLGGFGHRRARIQGNHRFLTDRGVMHVPVFMDAEGKPLGDVTIPLGEDLFNEASRTLTPSLDQPGTVRVTLQPLYEQSAADREVQNADDPGLKGHHTPEPPQPDAAPELTHEVELFASPTVRAWVRGAAGLGAASFDGRVFRSEAESDLKAIFGRNPTNHARVLSDDTRRFLTLVRDIPISLHAEEGKFRGTFFRVLGADGEPVPYAEAVLMPLETDGIATRMRELEKRLQRQGRRPPAILISNLWDDARILDVTPETPDSELREILDEDVWNALGTREFRLRYAMYGAWYDTLARMDGDPDGYVIAPHLRPEDGKEYVLYIWGQSRDDLKPDQRLVIKGQGAITDLGVIRLH